MLLNQIIRVIVIGNSLHYISPIILNHLLIYTSEFLGGRVKGLIINLYLLINRRLLLVLLIYNVIQNDVYHFCTLFLGL